MNIVPVSRIARAILDDLRENGHSTEGEVAQRTKLSRWNIRQALKDSLLPNNLVRSVSVVTVKPGKAARRNPGWEAAEAFQ